MPENTSFSDDAEQLNEREAMVVFKTIALNKALGGQAKLTLALEFMSCLGRTGSGEPHQGIREAGGPSKPAAAPSLSRTRAIARLLRARLCELGEGSRRRRRRYDGGRRSDCHQRVWACRR